jgi:hypothetical protein
MADDENHRFKWPADDDRIFIVGKVGTGKTRNAVHQLSHRSIDKMTWIAMDFKGDDTLAAMPVTDVMDISDDIPPMPGLFYVQVEPSRRGSATSDFFRRVYERGECGVLIDETLAIGQTNEGFNLCLFLGRSRRIPMIMLAQRPVGMEPNARAQATFWQILQITNRRDRDALREDIPESLIDLEQPLPRYHSHWYDVQRDYRVVLKPAPPEEESFERIARRMAPPPEDEQPEIPMPKTRVKL